MALAENQSTGSVVLIGVVLLTIVLTALSVYKAAGVPVDGEVLLQQRFAYDELPYGLEVKEAHQVSGGDKLVRLGPPEGKAVPEGMPVRVVVMYHRKALGPKQQDHWRDSKQQLPSLHWREAVLRRTWSQEVQNMRGRSFRSGCVRFGIQGRAHSMRR